MNEKLMIVAGLLSVVLVVGFIMGIGVRLNKQKKEAAQAAQKALADLDFDQKRKRVK